MKHPLSASCVQDRGSRILQRVGIRHNTGGSCREHTLRPFCAASQLRGKFSNVSTALWCFVLAVASKEICIVALSVKISFSV